jgi:hypothetical protein
MLPTLMLPQLPLPLPLPLPLLLQLPLLILYQTNGRAEAVVSNIMKPPPGHLSRTLAHPTTATHLALARSLMLLYGKLRSCRTCEAAAPMQ